MKKLASLVVLTVAVSLAYGAPAPAPDPKPEADPQDLVIYDQWNNPVLFVNRGFYPMWPRPRPVKHPKPPKLVKPGKHPKPGKPARPAKPVQPPKVHDFSDKYPDYDLFLNGKNVVFIPQYVF